MKRVTQANSNPKIPSKTPEDKPQEFKAELIKPCFCKAQWHRCCIHEYILKGEYTACPKCSFEYAIAYTDCYALFNKKRPNYLAYMLWQDILLSLLIVVIAVISDQCILYSATEGKSPVANIMWVAIIRVLSYASIALVLVLFFFRIKAKYSYREIEEVIVYDRSLKQKLDFDSPAILNVYFQETRDYEN